MFNSRNSATGEQEYKEVKVLVNLKIGKVNIDTTTTHPFWVIGKGWVPAVDLKENDKVLLASGEIETIDKKTIEELKESVKVYNFEVDEWHTYFVSDIGVFVHNMCAMTIPPNGAGKAELPSTINPKDVHFMQSSIKNQTGSHTVLENAEALRNGTLRPSDLPNIKVWKDDAGKIWTLDHRRLGAFKQAGLDEIPMQWATQEEVASQMWKMTTRNGGTSIRLKLGNGESMTIK